MTYKKMHYKDLSAQLMRSPFVWNAWTVQRNFLNNFYYVPTLSDLQTEVDNFSARLDELGLVYDLGAFDCDAYAYLCRGFLVLQAWKDGEMRHPWSVGMCLAGTPSGHAFNIAYVRDGEDIKWTWISPQNGEINSAVNCPWTDIWSADI